MQAFTHWKGTIVPLMRANIDTDQIIPKQFLTTVSRAGLGDYLFDSWRFADEGALGKKPRNRLKREEFVLNQPVWAGASILLTGANFGCGSSREHAAWSLLDYGIRVVIAPDFADIFFSNAITNGLLPAEVTAARLEQLADLVSTHPSTQCEIDLPGQRITYGNFCCDFVIDASSKTKLLKGLDAIGVTLEQADHIREFERHHLARQPWLNQQISA